MAIPKFEDFLYPFLYRLKDMDNVSIKDMKKSIIEHFHLSEEDCKLRTKSGSTNQLDDRLGWSRQWLRRALFIEIPQRGIYKITKRGIEYLKNHTDLRQTDLMEFPEFAEYATSSSGTSKKPSAKVLEVLEESKQTQTPTEQLENAYQSIIKDLAADLLQKVLEQSAQFFEHLVLDLLLKWAMEGLYLMQEWLQNTHMMTELMESSKKISWDWTKFTYKLSVIIQQTPLVSHKFNSLWEHLMNRKLVRGYSLPQVHIVLKLENMQRKKQARRLF